jgi:AraC family transcriptional regulator, regulatory protein of adaptative response / methylated-DNA-[protein]-cysteine methyltransferase
MMINAETIQSDFPMKQASFHNLTGPKLQVEQEKPTGQATGAGQSTAETTTWEEHAWEQLQARNAEAKFFYGVETTGIFCRPGCASRMPLRSNTRFFRTVEEAQASGFRACQRCRPEEAVGPSPVARMCAHLAANLERPVTLAELGRRVKMSPFSAQRLFKREMGATPAQYQRALRANGLREQLQKGATVTEAIYEAGYGSSSRVYEQAPLGMTPGRFQAGGRGERMRFGVAEAAGPNLKLGWMIVGATERGVCWLAIGDSAAEAEASLRAEFPAAEIAADSELEKTVRGIIAGLQGSPASAKLPLDLRGTAFQLRVWSALQEIPAGETKTYSQLAAEMGMPKSTRAVARACATNRVSVLVPCHRVVGVSGSLTGYRWGIERKRALLASERHRR